MVTPYIILQCPSLQWKVHVGDVGWNKIKGLQPWSVKHLHLPLWLLCICCIAVTLRGCPLCTELDRFVLRAIICWTLNLNCADVCGYSQLLLEVKNGWKTNNLGFWIFTAIREQIKKLKKKQCIINHTRKQGKTSRVHEAGRQMHQKGYFNKKNKL